MRSDCEREILFFFDHEIRWCAVRTVWCMEFNAERTHSHTTWTNNNRHLVLGTARISNDDRMKLKSNNNNIKV